MPHCINSLLSLHYCMYWSLPHPLCLCMYIFPNLFPWDLCTGRISRLHPDLLELKACCYSAFLGISEYIPTSKGVMGFIFNTKAILSDCFYVIAFFCAFLVIAFFFSLGKNSLCGQIFLVVSLLHQKCNVGGSKEYSYFFKLCKVVQSVLYKCLPKMYTFSGFIVCSTFHLDRGVSL